MYKVTVELPEGAYLWFMSFLALIEVRLGIKVKQTVREYKEQAEVGPGRATVRYSATGQAEAIAALGGTTVVALVFKHLLENGAKTNREVREETKFNHKTVNDSIYKLQKMGLIATVPIEAEEV